MTHLLACAEYLLKRRNADRQTQVTFSLLYFLTQRSLELGDTWLWFEDGQDKDTSSDEWGLSGNHWCVCLLRQALPFVDASLGRVYREFFCHLNLATTQAQEDELCDRLAKEVAGFGKVHSDNLVSLVRLLWRFYAYYRHLSLDEWYRTLKECFFCGERGYFVLGIFIKNSGFGLWLNRFWHAEHTLACCIQSLISTPTTTVAPLMVDDGLNDQQQDAVILAKQARFVMITGGPGTGKTHTVGRLVAQLLAQYPSLSLALAAPTGKAANRMQHSLVSALQDCDLSLPVATTVHRLLGLSAGNTPYYHADNPLPYDLIIIDESSMLGVTMASWLFRAVAPKSRLILLGDANQLAAVEAGAVLADLCRLPMLSDYHVHLTQSRRFDDHSLIGQLATLTQNNDPPYQRYQQLKSIISISPIDQKRRAYDALTAPYADYFSLCRQLYHQKRPLNQDDLTALFVQVNRYRVLCAGHLGEFGDERLNDHIAMTQKQHPLEHPPRWWHGLLVMVTKNSYSLGLFNGDVGVCLYHKGRLWVFFEGRHIDEAIATEQLSDTMVTKGYALTIHKSQGSEFDQVAICLDDSHERLLSTELLYTAITRAKHELQLFASDKALLTALSQKTTRNTGLFYLMNQLTPKR